MLTIKVGKMPGTIQEVAVADGAKVSDVLAAAGIVAAANEEIRVGGSVVTLDSTLTNNSIVLLTAKIKGNAPIMVKCGKMPGTIAEFAVESGTKVAAILELAGFTSIAGFEVRMSGAEVSGAALVTTNGAIILLTQKIKGN